MNYFNINYPIGPNCKLFLYNCFFSTMTYCNINFFSWIFNIFFANVCVYCSSRYIYKRRVVRALKLRWTRISNYLTQLFVVSFNIPGVTFDFQLSGVVMYSLLFVIIFWYLIDEIYFLLAMIFLEAINFLIVYNFCNFFQNGNFISIILSFFCLLLFACESVFGLLLLVVLKKNYRGNLLIAENNMLRG